MSMQVKTAACLDNFDKYVETANSMGMQDVIEVKKAQYARYQEIVGK